MERIELPGAIGRKYRVLLIQGLVWAQQAIGYPFTSILVAQQTSDIRLSLRMIRARTHCTLLSHADCTEDAFGP